MPVNTTYFPPGYFGPGLTEPAPPAAPSAGAQYTHTTFSEAKQKLANRLGDPAFIFWTEAELGRYLIDALRHWSLLAQYYKDKAIFTTSNGEAFYSLSTNAATLRGHTTTDQDLIYLIQHHLMEPATGSSWAGTEQFTFSDLISSINERRDALLLETGLTLTVDSILTTSPPIQTIGLFETLIDLRRVATKSITGVYKTLRERDSKSRKSFAPRASYTPGIAEAYLSANKPHTFIELSPPSIDIESLHLISTKAGATVDGTGVVLGIPDDLLPTLKWGVLADLLSIERASDPARADYCDARWREGIEAAKLMPTIWSMEIQGRQVTTASLAELDAFSANWQNVTGEPTTVASAGFDLVALSPVPNGVYSVTAEVTRKAIVPTTDSDYIQIGREHLETIYGYASHLAAFKQGGDAFMATKGEMESFFKAAQQYNDRLRAQAFYVDSISDQSTREQRERPREVGAVPLGGVR